MQVVETSFLNPELELDGNFGTHSIRPPQPQPTLQPLRHPGSPVCFCWVCFSWGSLWGLEEDTAHPLWLSLPHPLLCTLCSCLLRALEPALCLPSQPHGPPGAQLQSLPKLNIDQNLFQPALVARSGGGTLLPASWCKVPSLRKSLAQHLPPRMFKSESGMVFNPRCSGNRFFQGPGTLQTNKHQRVNGGCEGRE